MKDYIYFVVRARESEKGERLNGRGEEEERESERRRKRETIL